MTELEKKELAIAACKVRMGIIEGTHAAKADRPGGGLSSADLFGGLGDAVCSLLAEKCPVPVRRIGVNDEFGHSGPAAALLKQFGLSAEHIAEVSLNFLK